MSSEHHYIHWPDHNIGKRESRRIREAHNAVLSDLNAVKRQKDMLLAACKRALPYLADHVAMTSDQGPGDRFAHDEMESAIAECEKGGV